MIYEQKTPMQWLTFYYYGNEENKILQAKERNLQMTKKIRYANVIEESQSEKLEILSDTKDRFVGITPDGLIVMFENNLSKLK
ncbi:hypothetical protein D7X33_22265 [Butyricicoccus sp. 1XD8-22]|nr:hypothetical protein D7X33_22265 [Butyricicoccus sp. 1XD8-22]